MQFTISVHLCCSKMFQKCKMVTFLITFFNIIKWYKKKKSNQYLQNQSYKMIFIDCVLTAV